MLILLRELSAYLHTLGWMSEMDRAIGEVREGKERVQRNWNFWIRHWCKFFTVYSFSKAFITIGLHTARGATEQ